MEERYIYIVITPNSGILAILYGMAGKQEAEHMAEVLKGVVAKLPIIKDFRR